jgi:hypothetical protein
MKNLADFKRFLAENINTNILISSKTITGDNKAVMTSKEPATIGHMQSNSFAMNRQNAKGEPVLSWVEFKKASDWTFEGCKAIQKNQFGETIFVIHQQDGEGIKEYQF